jgi:DNA-binding PadR family transcriptional regulator
MSTQAFVVLGMVRLGARTGYEIGRAVQDSIRFFWTISHAQIYPSLEALERDGLIRGRDEPAGRRPRRVYEITADGEQALRVWLGHADPIPFELRDTGMLKLFFAGALHRDGAAELLRSVRARSADRVRELEAIENEAIGNEAGALAADGLLFPLLTLRMGIAYHEAMVSVCDEFEERL